MNPIDTSKHTKYSLELIFSEADKMSEALLKSLSENVNKSFVLFALYASLISFSFVQVTSKDWIYLFLLVGVILSAIVLYKNLFPFVIVFRGSEPSKIITSYFDNFNGEDLDKELLATQIENYEDAMTQNRDTIVRMVRRFNNSIKTLIFSVLLFVILWYFQSFAECL